MRLNDDDMVTTPGPGDGEEWTGPGGERDGGADGPVDPLEEGPADGGTNPAGRDGGADGGAFPRDEGPADGGATPGRQDGGADGGA